MLIKTIKSWLADSKGCLFLLPKRHIVSPKYYGKKRSCSLNPKQIQITIKDSALDHKTENSEETYIIY